MSKVSMAVGPDWKYDFRSAQRLIPSSTRLRAAACSTDESPSNSHCRTVFKTSLLVSDSSGALKHCCNGLNAPDRASFLHLLSRYSVSCWFARSSVVASAQKDRTLSHHNTRDTTSLQYDFHVPINSFCLGVGHPPSGCEKGGAEEQRSPDCSFK